MAMPDDLRPDARRDALARMLRPAGGGIHTVSTGRETQARVQLELYGTDDPNAIQREFLERIEALGDARLVLLGVPSDNGAGYARGASFGPQELRRAVMQSDSAFYARDDVLDIGDVFTVPQLLEDGMLSEAQLGRARRALTRARRHRHEPPDAQTPAEPAAASGSRATGDADDLAAVAQAAERFRQCLSALDDAARDRLLAAVSAADPFARAHGADYLAALALEAGRVGSSAGSAAERLAKPQQQARPSAARPSPARAQVDVRAQASEPQPQMPDAAALHFIRQAARVYQESFDTAPTTRAAGPFARALAAIAKVTGLLIPTRVADLKRALSG